MFTKIVTIMMSSKYKSACMNIAEIEVTWVEFIPQGPQLPRVVEYPLQPLQPAPAFSQPAQQ